MESLTRRFQFVRRGPLAAMLLAAAACTACGPQVIEGRPPFVSIATLSLVENDLTAEFRVDNQNEVAMNIQAVDITVAVNDAELLRENRNLQLSIDANSAEDVRVAQQPSDLARDSLMSLERHEVNSLPFTLSGRVLTQEDGYLRFEQKGHLYPVPGRPGSFRSAVTQAQELRRDDKL